MNTNVVILTGNLTRDPEMRYTPSGHAVTDFTIAVNDGFGDKQDTDFIECTVWEESSRSSYKLLPEGN